MSTLSAQIIRGFGLIFLLMISSVSLASDNHIITDTSQRSDNEQLTPADEHIISFDSWARFNLDGSMEVRENITVFSLGNEIRRGIFRTLPLTWH